MTRKVLITGGFGYVGSRLTPLLLSQGYSVRVIDLCLYGESGLTALQSNAEYPEWKGRFEFLKEDIRSPDSLTKALYGITDVIHLAAISNDPTGQVDEILTRQVNFDAVGMLLSLARQSGVSRFINASSSSVMGIKHEPNVNESLEPEPLTYYSKYKMLSEWLVAAAACETFCAVNIRPATICGYSPRQRFDLTVNKLTADAFQKKQITVHGGHQRRPNVGMTDMINLYSSLLEVDPARLNSRTFHFGFENLKVIEIAELVRNEMSDLNIDIKVTETTDPRDYHISSEKIVRELGYKPVSSIKKEIGELRKCFENDMLASADAVQYHNMLSMKLSRDASAYMFLSR